MACSTRFFFPRTAAAAVDCAADVVATLRGTGATDGPDRIVVSAHIDSRKDSPGALDNASGTATKNTSTPHNDPATTMAV